MNNKMHRHLHLEGEQLSKQKPVIDIRVVATRSHLEGDICKQQTQQCTSPRRMLLLIINHFLVCRFLNSDLLLINIPLAPKNEKEKKNK